MAGLTLDAGALIATERLDRKWMVYLKAAVARQATLTVPAGVLAQSWRPRSARIARLLKSCEIEPLDEQLAKRCGHLMGRVKQSDVVDASVVIGASRRGDVVVTSDPGDIERLAEAHGRSLKILRV